MVIGQEAAWAGLWLPRAEWVFPLFTFMPGIADVPRWKGQSRFKDTIVWGMLAPFVTGAAVSLCRVGIRALVGWPD
jgi:hypothetical protein